MTQYGPNAGSTAADDATIGIVSWSNPSNALANDASYATAGLQDGSGGCFVAGTLVNTPLGEVPIESLAVDDLVFANPDCGQLARITRLIRIRSTNRLKLSFNAFAIEVTPDHPFRSELGQWIKAGEICLGESLTGHVVMGIDVIAQPVDVFNLSVEWPHTFMVHGIEVHNK